MTNDLNSTLAERGSRYGKFTSHARITQELKAVISGHTPLGRIHTDGTSGDHLAPDQQEALDTLPEVEALRRQLRPGEGMNELLRRIVNDRIATPSR